jgi:tetratricopeptide (TPR) repeat protein
MGTRIFTKIKSLIPPRRRPKFDLLYRWRAIALLIGTLVTLWLAPVGGGGPRESWGLAQAQVSDQADLEVVGDREAVEALRQQAFDATNRGDFATAEQYWTQLLDYLPQEPALWSNRGNARVSQRKLKLAIEDYNQAIRLAPEAPDPYLNRGAALEGLGEWDAAIADYNRVLELDPQDPAAYNNRGNAEAGQGQWQQAVADFTKAAELAPDYAFAQANRALALYQLGETQDAIRQMRNLVRKYPRFADMRAALTAALWVNGQQGEAESNWVAVTGLDRRYKDLNWVQGDRRWPPAMVEALQRFLNLN